MLLLYRNAMDCIKKILFYKIKVYRIRFND